MDNTILNYFKEVIASPEKQFILLTSIMFIVSCLFPEKAKK